MIDSEDVFFGVLVCLCIGLLGFVIFIIGQEDNIIPIEKTISSGDMVVISCEEPSGEVIHQDTEYIRYLGTFKVTHYCACTKCCGPNAQGITASGVKVDEMVTIAVDPKVIELGTKVFIDGYGEKIAQDTGSAIKGNVIDVYIADHDEALQKGVCYKDVYLID